MAMRHLLPGGRPLIYLALLAALGISALPAGSTTHPVYFAETAQTVSGRFLEVWRDGHTYQESVAINGYPISPLHDEVNPTDGKTYRVQWFERARFEAHPEVGAPDDVQLSLLGKNAIWDTRRSEPPFQPVSKPGDAGPDLVWFDRTGHTVRAGFLQFWTKYGGVKQFGYPLSEEFPETSRFDGKEYTVQYFERSRFEWHPGTAPEFGGVVLGQLGIEQSPYGPRPSPAPSRPAVPR
ncbi:MAG TPA: hypothetical protein VM536_12410 [Chloroflexia bacterium]|nr:hypothetical protein [Chloroflexia bacterium]